MATPRRPPTLLLLAWTGILCACGQGAGLPPEAGVAVPFRPAGARPVPGQYRDHDFRWIGFAVNPRVIIYNSTALKKEEAPTETTDLVKPPWAGKGAMPRIAAGPAAFHATALFMLWGPERARAFFESLRTNG